MLSYMLLRNRLVPRWLAVLGLIGYMALLGASVLDMLGIVDTVAGLGLDRRGSTSDRALRMAGLFLPGDKKEYDTCH
jgi:hypothetical protein